MPWLQVGLNEIPAADLRGAMPPAKSKHLPAITEPDKVAGLLRAIDGYEGSFVTNVRCALPLYFLFVPGSFVTWNGQKSTLTQRSGTFLKKR
jgi:hypothetical protein